MIVDESLISKLEKLSKLALTAEERDRLIGELQEVLNMFEKVADAELDDDVVHADLTLDNARSDEPVVSSALNLLIRNAQHIRDNFFVLPKYLRPQTEENE